MFSLTHERPGIGRHGVGDREHRLRKARRPAPGAGLQCLWMIPAAAVGSARLRPRAWPMDDPYCSC